MPATAENKRLTVNVFFMKSLRSCALEKCRSSGRRYFSLSFCRSFSFCAALDEGFLPPAPSLRLPPGAAAALGRRDNRPDAGSKSCADGMGGAGQRKSMAKGGLDFVYLAAALAEPGSTVKVRWEVSVELDWMDGED